MCDGRRRRAEIADLFVEQFHRGAVVLDGISSTVDPDVVRAIFSDRVDAAISNPVRNAVLVDL
jgi:hypothetical protein